MTNTVNSFWGQYRFLSNFYKWEIIIWGIRFRTLEHAFQATKTFNLIEKQKIADCATPGEAKRLGKEIICRPDWEHVKIQVMLDLLRIKFVLGSELANWLLATGDARLIEGNTWGDTFWGVYKGIGENWLGKLLMLVRQELREQLENW